MRERSSPRERGSTTASTPRRSRREIGSSRVSSTGPRATTRSSRLPPPESRRTLLAIERPPGRPKRRGGGDAKSYGRPEPVEIPRWRTGARRAVFGGEGIAADSRGPALVRVALGKAQERRPIGDADRRPLEDEVDAGERNRADAVGV